MKLELRPLGTDELSSFACLLGGAEFGGCFCAVWTSFDDTWVARCRDPSRPNLALTRRDVEAGRKAGFLVYHEGELIAWTGAGPKTEFPAMATRHGGRLSSMSSDTWVVGCLAIKEAWRGKGVATAIVRAILARAAEAGAMRVEAYPTRPWDEPRSYRGALAMYDKLGFEEVGSDPDGESAIVQVVKRLR